ncbi:helix-turn-helix transcriptional regulator [Streptomyces sp. NPDC093085]|uniref:helix-turn-helix transcriptional regulator n=1 Tax=Streptomyces sp. NPDC093085 TaxID=3155068 RepID=UPI00343B500D
MATMPETSRRPDREPSVSAIDVVGSRRSAVEADLADAIRTAHGHYPITATVPDTVSSGFRASLLARHIDDIRVVDLRTDPFEARLGAEDDGQHGGSLAVLIPRHGAQTVRTGDHEFTLSRGQALLWRSNTGGGYAIPSGYAARTLVLPPRLAASLFSGRPDFPGGAGADVPVLRCQGAPVTLLDGYLEQLLPIAPQLAPPARAAAVRALTALVAGILPDGAQNPAHHAADDAYHRVIRWMDRHLGSADLPVTRAAHAQHMSVRTLNRVFAAEGTTYASTLRRRRLDHALEDMTSSPSLTVAAAALRWGFADASHLARSLKQAYGLTPSQARGRHAPDLAAERHRS